MSTRRTGEDGTDTRGFVFATTGPDYTTLARRAARTLRAAMPDARIDLFTDQDVSDDVFERIHTLGDSFFRPKIEAMQRSRFDRTVLLDADVVVLLDVSDLFDILEICDLAGAHGSNRGPEHIKPEDNLPRSHAVINTGVLVFRRCEALDAFAKAWGERLRTGGGSMDQPSFRKLVWEMDIRFFALPREYNMIQIMELHNWGFASGAPRILHVRALHNRPPGNPASPFALKEVLGPRLARHVRDLLKVDPLLLTDRPFQRVRPPILELLGKKPAPTRRDRILSILPTRLRRLFGR